MKRKQEPAGRDWIEIDLGNGVKKRIRRTPENATTLGADPPVCPLAPHIPLGPVDEVGVYAVASDADPYEMFLVLVGYGQGSSDAKDLTPICGGGSFILVYLDAADKLLGTSHVVLPGEPSERVKRKLEDAAVVRSSRRDTAAADAKADREFRATLRADEDFLLAAFAELHHGVVHERFGTGGPEDREKRLSSMLAAAERGVERLVGRMKARPDSSSWWSLVVAGVGVWSVISWAFTRYAAVAAPAAEKKP